MSDWPHLTAQRKGQKHSFLPRGPNRTLCGPQGEPRPPQSTQKGDGRVAVGEAPPENREQREGDKGPPICSCRPHPLPQHCQVCGIPRHEHLRKQRSKRNVRKITQCGTAPTSSPRPRTDAWRRLECGGRRCAWRGRLAFAVLARLRRLPNGARGFILLARVCLCCGC